MQSRAEVVTLRQGEAVIFPVQHRPVRGTRGFHRVTMRHGVSRLRAGERLTLGVIFHDGESARPWTSRSVRRLQKRGLRVNAAG